MENHCELLRVELIQSSMQAELSMGSFQKYIIVIGWLVNLVLVGWGKWQTAINLCEGSYKSFDLNDMPSKHQSKDAITTKNNGIGPNC